MSSFKSSTKRIVPSIGTAALPDIIFMLLFFFMVVTVLREHQLLIKVTVPKASELQQLKHRSLVNNLYIGHPIYPKRGTAPMIQINDAFVKLGDLPLALARLEKRVPEYQRNRLVNALKVDQEVRMGIVSDVKLALRKARQLNVSYVATKKEE